MIKTAICYRVKKPVRYHDGTTCDHFLRYLTYKDIEEGRRETEEMNRTHPEKDCLGRPIDWDEIAEFFAKEQEDFY